MTKQNLAPIAFFCYNRPEHTRRTLEALSNNKLADQSILYIYSDGPKKNADDTALNAINATRKVLREKQWCKEIHIIEPAENKGLTKNIVEGITEVVNKHGKTIIVEDDILASPGFLQYMNHALNLYENDTRVMHVSGFIPYPSKVKQLPETYFLRLTLIWGWGTWKRAWEQYSLDNNLLYERLKTLPNIKEYNLDGAYDFLSPIKDICDGTLETWDYQWYASAFLNNGLGLYPSAPLVQNIGMDGSGEHCGTIDDSPAVNLAEMVEVTPIPIEENKLARKYFRQYYQSKRKLSLTKRIRSFLKTPFVHSMSLKLKKI